MAWVVRDVIDGLEWARDDDPDRAEQARQQLLRATPALLGKLVVGYEPPPDESPPVYFHERGPDGVWRRTDVNPKTRRRAVQRWVF